MIRRLLIFIWVVAILCVCSLLLRSRHTFDTFSFLSKSDTDHTFTIERGSFTIVMTSHATSLPPTVNPIDSEQRNPGWSHTSFTEPRTQTNVQTTPQAASHVPPTSLAAGITKSFSGSLTLPGNAHDFLGIRWGWVQMSWRTYSGNQLINQRSDWLTIPYWMVLLILLLPPAIQIRRAYRRWRRVSLNHCLHCGYDRRGGGTRCPECGNIYGAPASVIASPDAQ